LAEKSGRHGAPRRDLPVKVEEGRREQADGNDADELYLKQMPANAAASNHPDMSCESSPAVMHDVTWLSRFRENPEK
jgi:hypothetical protein